MALRDEVDQEKERLDGYTESNKDNKEVIEYLTNKIEKKNIVIRYTITQLKNVLGMPAVSKGIKDL